MIDGTDDCSGASHVDGALRQSALSIRRLGMAYHDKPTVNLILNLALENDVKKVVTTINECGGRSRLKIFVSGVGR